MKWPNKGSNQGEIFQIRHPVDIGSVLLRDLVGPLQRRFEVFFDHTFIEANVLIYAEQVLLWRSAPLLDPLLDLSFRRDSEALLDRRRRPVFGHRPLRTQHMLKVLVAVERLASLFKHTGHPFFDAIAFKSGVDPLQPQNQIPAQVFDVLHARFAEEFDDDAFPDLVTNPQVPDDRKVISIFDS